MSKRYRNEDNLAEWDINISILNNPLFWFQLLMVSVISSSFLLFLLVGLNLYEDQWQDIPSSFFVATCVSGGIFIASSLIALMMYGQGIPTRYVLKENYIEQHTLSRSKKTRGLLGLFGLLSGGSAGYTAAGASLLAQSRESLAVSWKDTTGLKIYSKRHEIRLDNDWHTIMQIVCPNDEFDKILKIIQEKTRQSIAQEKAVKTDANEQKKETPFAFKMMLSVFTLIFGIFLFPKLPIHYVGIFAIATIIFALLSIWSSGKKRQFFAGILILLPPIGVGVAFKISEMSLHRVGSIYALIIEGVILAFFILLGLGVLLKKIR